MATKQEVAASPSSAHPPLTLEEDKAQGPEQLGKEQQCLKEGHEGSDPGREGVQGAGEIVAELTENFEGLDLEGMDPVSSEEPPPLSFEDLPNQAIGMILSRLGGLDSKRPLIQASPSAYRLTHGPTAEPGVLGIVYFKFYERASAKQPFKESQHGYLEFKCFPDHPDFLAARSHFLQRMQRQARAFSDVHMDVSLQRALEVDFARELLSMLGGQVSGKVTLHLSMGTTSEHCDLARSLVDALVSACPDPARCALDLGDHMRLLALWSRLKPEGPMIAFLSGLRGLSSLTLPKVEHPILGDRIPFPAIPGLSTCLTSLDSRRLWTGLPTDLRGLSSFAYSLESVEESSLSQFLYPLAGTLNFIELAIEDFPGVFSLAPFASLSKLASLSITVTETVIYPPSDDPYYRKQIFLPSLNVLALKTDPDIWVGDENDPTLVFPLMSNLCAPQLRDLDLIDFKDENYLESLEFDLDLPLDTDTVCFDLSFLSSFPSLENVTVGLGPSIDTVTVYPRETSLSLRLGDLSGLKLLERLEVTAPRDMALRADLGELKAALPAQLTNDATAEVSLSRASFCAELYSTFYSQASELQDENVHAMTFQQRLNSASDGTWTDEYTDEYYDTDDTYGSDFEH